MANPVSFESHKEQIRDGIDLIRSWNLGIRIVGLFVNEWNSIDLIYDTDKEFKEIRSFLKTNEIHVCSYKKFIDMNKNEAVLARRRA